jgi:hypothetical protein
MCNVSSNDTNFLVRNNRGGVFVIATVVVVVVVVSVDTLRVLDELPTVVSESVDAVVECLSNSSFGGMGGRTTTGVAVGCAVTVLVVVSSSLTSHSRRGGGDIFLASTSKYKGMYLLIKLDLSCSFLLLLL